MQCMDCKRTGVETEVIRIASRETAEVCVDSADCKAFRALSIHTKGGKVIGPEGLPYGVTHDYQCPGCAGTSFLASPRSETYWSS